MVKQTAEIVALTLASGAGARSTEPVQTWFARSTRAESRVVALAGMRRLTLEPTATEVVAAQDGPVPATTCPVTAASVPVGTAGLAFGTTTLRLTVAIWLATSPFHQEKWEMVARSALPVGEAALATTVPLPSWVHRPVPAFSDQSAIVSPTATALPPWCRPA